MKSIISILLQFCMVTLFAQQQQWRSQFEPKDMYGSACFLKELPSGDLVSIYLTSDGNGNTAITLVKVAACGDEATRYVFDAPNYNPEWLLNTVQDDAGNLYIFGLLNDTQPDGIPFISKFSKNLTHVFTKTYGNHNIHPYTFEINGENELFLMFNTDNNTHGNGLLKLNDKGQVIWAKSHGYSPIWGHGGPTAGGGFVHSTGSVIFKTSKGGAMQWRKWMSGGYVRSNVSDFAGGHLYYQKSQGGINTSRLILLNSDGSLRWRSKELPDFNGVKIEIINNSEALVTGSGYGQTGTGTQLGLVQLTVNQQGDITSNKVFHKSGEQLLTNSFDNIKQNFLLENKQLTSGASALFISKLPPSLDSLSCYTTYNTREVTETTVDHSSLTPIAASGMAFSVATVNLTQNSSDPINIQQICLVETAGDAFSLGNDTSLCPGTPLTLSGPAGYTYNWNTGASTQSITVTKTGLYIVEATTSCGKQTVTDSIYVDYFQEYNPVLRLNKTVFALDEQLLAEASGIGTGISEWYRNNWFVAGGNTLSLNTSELGKHSLVFEYTDENGCYYTDSVEYIVRYPVPKVPNVFTPNGDGVNDFFKLLGAEGLSYSFQIFNRNGTLVYQSNNQPWDGQTLQGNLAAAGVYFYVISYQDMAEPLRGNVTLVR